MISFGEYKGVGGREITVSYVLLGTNAPKGQGEGKPPFLVYSWEQIL